MARQPVCIMLMPFGQKETQLPPGIEPQGVDFDRLWAYAFRPLVEKLGYEAVRLDHEVGTSVLREMIERLTLCDLLVADLSLSQPSLLYEIGVRHAAKAKGCVLVGATWARWPSSTSELEHLPYPLPSGRVTQAEAQAIHRALEAPLTRRRDHTSPCYELTGFPTLEPSRSIAFRAYLRELARFQKRVIETRLTRDPTERARRAEALARRFLGKELSPPLALELLLLVRDCAEAGWKDQLRFIDGLPEGVRRMAAVREQRSLAIARLGEHREAIAELQRLIEEHGDTAGRRALLGARWKSRFQEAEQARARGAKVSGRELRRYLDWTIEEYERGMLLDLNNCECLANLPRLLRRRGDDGDEARAARIASAALLACERRWLARPDDDWLRAALITAAADAADVASARRYVADLARRPLPAWLMDSLVVDLDESLRLLPPGAATPGLEVLRDELRDRARTHRARRGLNPRSRASRPPAPSS